MKTTLRRIGNSEGVIIPRTMLAIAGLVDVVDMTVERGSIVLRKPPKVRAGWAEASRALAAAGDGALIWPEIDRAGGRS